MNCIAASSLSDNKGWVFYGCLAGYLLLAWWSARGVRRGKPAIPPYILLIIPLAAYVYFLEHSLPRFWMNPTHEKTSLERSYKERTEAETNHMLRRDLDRVREDLDKCRLALEQHEAVTREVLHLAWLAALWITCTWLGRPDDRNTPHGGIPPPPGHEPPDTP